MKFSMTFDLKPNHKTFHIKSKVTLFLNIYFFAMLETVDSVERGRERERERERGDDIQQMTTGWIRTQIGCGKDSAFIHGLPTLTTALYRHPSN